MLLNPLNNKNGCYVYILSSNRKTLNLSFAETERVTANANAYVRECVSVCWRNISVSCSFNNFAAYTPFALFNSSLDIYCLFFADFNIL